MIPAGYMLKHVAGRTDWLDAPQVAEVCSLSRCISKPFADYTAFWRHNDFWLFDTPQVIQKLVATRGIDTAGARLFYYEAYEQQHDGQAWAPLRLSGDFPPMVEPPAASRLLGYDVVTWGDAYECSPLSCNGMAEELPVNAHCLFDTLDEARRAIDENRFEGCEPGIYRILAVREVG